MFTILLSTSAFRPSHVVTLRTSLDWSRDVAGVFEGDAWRFDLSSFEYRPRFEFKFLLDRARWMANENLSLWPEEGGSYSFREGTDLDVAFEDDPTVSSIARLGDIDDCAFARRTIQMNLNEDDLHDVIVVGSGMGGGIVAEQLADLGRKVLLLESGSLLLPTHVGNLPRYYDNQNWGGPPRIVKNIWSLWDKFRVNDAVNVAGSDYIGGQGYNLGGRSMFWGGYIPRMVGVEFARWPTRVRRELEATWYDRAEALLKRSALETEYQKKVQDGVGRALDAVEPGGFEVATLPVAIEHGDLARRSVPAGVFSTGELLIEALQNPGKDAGTLAVNLNHHVLRIETRNRSAASLITQDLISHSIRRYRARTIVLCAGSIGSARIALESRLVDPYARIGKGITDHPIFFAHFRVPTASPFFEKAAGAKVMFRNRNATETKHRYIGFVDVGSEFNQSRFTDIELRSAHESWTEDFMLAEIVFQLNSPLDEANWVGRPTGLRSPLRLARATWTSAEHAEMSEIKDRLIEALGGEPLDPDSSPGLLGGNSTGIVAHEAGSLRIGPQGVVDENLKFHAYDNLYACDLSVFPSSPAANPSLTLAALALRLATYIHRSLD